MSTQTNPDSEVDKPTRNNRETQEALNVPGVTAACRIPNPCGQGSNPWGRAKILICPRLLNRV
jgi:hypothetical protein